MKITQMRKKQKMSKLSYLIGLSIGLFIYSCQSNQKNETLNQIDSVSKTELAEISEQTQIDTLTVQDRRLEGGNFHSHIKLDFAKTTIKISDTSQIRLINKKCAISVIPDTLWINQQQKEIGDDWNEVVSDNQYYEQLAIDTLEKLDIPTFFAAREKRFVNFIKEDKSSFMIDLAKMNDAWGLILFNGKDNPVLWSSTEIDDELNEIFKINLQDYHYKENLKLATKLFTSKSDMPDSVLIKIAPKNIEEFILLYHTTSPDSKMQKTGFFHKITQNIFDKVIIENDNNFYLPSIQLASFADGEFGEGFIENLEKIIELDTSKFCESIKAKEYSSHNPIKYYAEQNKCK